MKKLMLVGLTLAALPALGAEKLKVVTTIETFADLARRVGGDRVEVESLSRGYQDPHFVDARPNLMVSLHKADLLVRVGMDLEVGWLPPLVLGARNERIQRGATGDLDCSTAIEPLDVPATRIDRSQGDIHPMGNPHYWLPPVNAVRLARAIADRLSQLRPDEQAYFADQLAKFVGELKARARAWDEQAKALASTKVVTYHQSFSYVSKWLGLVEVGYVENRPGVPPSPDHLAALITRMKADKVKLVMMEDFYNRSIAEDVAEKAGARLVPVASNVGARPEIKSYFDLVDALLKALRPPTGE
jgi:zinc/manganese transport system substrate-binding protein